MPISSHPFSQEQIMAYLDGELSGSEAMAVVAHLQHCCECRELAADLQSVTRHLSAWQIDEPSPALPERLQADFNASHPNNKGKLTWFRSFTKYRKPLGVLVACVALLVVVSALFSRHSQMSISPQTYTTYTSAYAAKRQRTALATLSTGVVGGDLQSAGEPKSAPPPSPAQAVNPSGPLIVRMAQLSLTTGDFAHTRESVSRILQDHSGYIAQLEMSTPAGQPRSLDATLRVPAAQLDATLLDLKRLGHVDAESQRGEEVAQRVVDIQARLSNLRITEARLNDILRQRTGKLADVLAVEEQVDSVRGQIENIEAEQKSLNQQIAFAAVQLKASEEYRKPLALNNVSLLTRLRNAAVEGFQTLADGAIELLLFLLSYGPTLLIVAALLFYPVRSMWRHRQKWIA